MPHEMDDLALGDIDADFADVLERQSRGEDANAILSDLVAAGKEEPRICIRLAHSLERRGDLAGAEVAFRRAREIDPAAVDANAGLAGVLERAGRRAEAIDILDRLARVRPREIGIQVRLGQVLIRAGELDGAEAVFRRAIELDGASVECRRVLANVLDAQGRSREGAEILQLLAAEQTGDPGLHARLGQLLIRAGDLAGAEVALRRAIALDPGSVESHHLLADVLDAQGRSREGAEILQRSVAQGSDDAGLYARIGRLSIRGGDLAGAEVAYRRAIALDPGSVESRRVLANVLDAQGRSREGAEILQLLAAEHTGDARLYARLGQLLIRADDLAGAEAALRRAIALDPGSVESRRVLADVLDAQGRSREGAEILQVLAAEHTGDARLHARLGQLSIRADDPAGAEAALRRAVALDPTSLEYHHLLADVLDARGRSREGAEIPQRSVAQGTDDARFYARLGQLSIRADDLAGAEAALHRAVTLDPTSLESHRLLADVLDAQGRSREGAEILQLLAAEQTGDAGLHARLGQLLIRAGDLAGAEVALRRAIALDPAPVESRRALADVLDAQGQSREGAEILLLAAEQTGDARLHARLGQLSIRADDLPGAEAALRRAVALDPTSVESHRLLADVLDARGRSREGAEILQLLAAEHTGDPRLYARLAQVSIRADDLAGAEAALRRTVTLDPASVESRRLLADVLDARGRSREGAEILQLLAAEHTGDARLYARLGQLLIRADDLAGAEAALRRAIALDPGSVESRRVLADVLDAQGRSREGAEILQLLAAEYTGDARLYARLGQLSVRGGDLAIGEAALRRAIALDPASVESRRALADVLDAQGRSREGAETLQLLAAEHTGDARLYARLAQVSIRAGDLAGAEAALRHAVGLDPASLEYPHLLADALDAQGRSREGAEILKLLAAEHTGDARLYARLGQLLIRADDLAGAEAALRRAVALDSTPADPWHDLANVLKARGRRAQAITISERLVAAASNDDRFDAHLAEKLRPPKSKSPLVSIVCVTYNHDRFIAEAITGMLAQTYAPLDIIILDDASTDATAQIIQDELAKYPQRHDIRFIRNERNLGIRDNFEKGVSLARGSFICKAHGDDIMMPTMIEEMTNVWRQEEISLVATNAIYIDEHSNELGRFYRDPAGLHDDSFETLARDGANVVCFGATQGFDRSLYDEFGWPPEYLTSDDIMLAFYGHLAKGTRFLPEPLLKYRVHGHNASLGLEAERSNGKEKLLVEAEIHYVMMAHSVLMRSEIERLNHADPARYGEIYRRIKPLLELQTSEMAKKLVNTRLGLRQFGVSRLTAATGSNGH